MRGTFFLLLPVCLFAFQSRAEKLTFADKNFYLIDSLVLSELTLDDRNLLDRGLPIYHESLKKIDKIRALEGICENMIHESWEDYQRFQLRLIEETLKKKHEKEDLKELNRSLALALNNMGMIYSRKGEIERAFYVYRRSLKLGKLIGDIEVITDPLYNLGRLYEDKGELNLAMLYTTKALKLSLFIKDKKSVASALHMLAIVNTLKGKRLKALEYDRKALWLRRAIGDKYGIAESLNAMGLHYSFLGQKEKALEFYTQSLRASEAIGDKHGEARALANMGTIYMGMHSFQVAETNYKKALKIYEEIGRKKMIAGIWNKMATVYAEKFEYGKALELYKKSFKLAIGLNNKRIMSSSSCNISKCYLQQEQFDSAMVYAEKSLSIAQESGYTRFIKHTSEVLGKTYEYKGQIEKALEMHKLYKEVRDRLDATELARAMIKMEYKNSMDKQNQVIELLENEKELGEVKFRMSLILYGIGTSILVFLGVFWFRRKRRKYEKELNALRALKLEEETQELDEEISSILVKRGRKLSTVELCDVICFRGESNYVLLEDQEGKEYIVDYTLTKLEEILPTNFVRIHRSVILNKDEILSITKGYRSKWVFTMQGIAESKIESSAGYLEVAKQIIEDFKSKSF